MAIPMPSSWAHDQRFKHARLSGLFRRAFTAEGAVGRGLRHRRGCWVDSDIGRLVAG